MIGLSTFTREIANRKVVLYSDNTGFNMFCAYVCSLPSPLHHISGAESATLRGSARSFDHNALVHEIWLHVYKCKTRLWIERVPTADNISDCPSRGDYGLMREIGAVWCKPVLAELYLGSPYD